MKKIVFLDMDGVLANFEGALAQIIQDPPEMFLPGFFRNLKPMEGAKEAIAILLANPRLDIYIGSKPSSKNTLSATEKMDWVAEHFPALKDRIVLVCDKSLLRGHFLIDDDVGLWGHKFKGAFFHFDRNKPKEEWTRVVELLKDI